MPKKSGASFPIQTRGKRRKSVDPGSEDSYRLLIQNSPDVISNLDRHGTILFINRTLPQYAVEEVLGTCVSEYHSAEEASRFLRLLEETFDSGEPRSLEMEAVGATHWLTRIFPIRRDGKVESALVIATDITELKRTEWALLESSELNGRIVEAVPGGIVQVGAGGSTS
jgi:PAS domain S-box-containing protein